MEIGIMIVLSLLFLYGFLGSAFSAGKHPKSLPPPEPQTPDVLPAARPRVPSLEERMEAVGIPIAAAYEGMGSYGIDVESVQSGGFRWCPFATYGAEWLGRLFAVSVEHLRMSRENVPPSVYCDRCDDVMGMALYEVVKKPVPPGEFDQGWTEPRALGRWCRRCGGLQADRSAGSRVLGTLWTEHADLHGLVEALESDESKRKLREAKLACVEAELEDVEGRRNRLMHERMRLQDELGALKGPPNRDRFAADPRTAALEDAPDARTRALPALVTRNGPWGGTADD